MDRARVNKSFVHIDERKTNRLGHLLIVNCKKLNVCRNFNCVAMCYAVHEVSQ